MALTPAPDPYLIVPIEKYSSLQPTREAVIQDLRWDHMNQHGMAVEILRMSFDFEPGSVVCMKVISPSRDLEYIRLQELCQMSSKYHPRKDFFEYPISAVTKSPRMAITFKDDHAMYRRFQIRFRNDMEYQAILKVLTDLQCPLRESLGRPNTAASVRPEATLPRNPTLEQHHLLAPGLITEGLAGHGGGLAQGPQSQRTSSVATQSRSMVSRPVRPFSADQVPGTWAGGQGDATPATLVRPGSSLELPPLPTPTFANRQSNQTSIGSSSSLSEAAAQKARKTSGPGTSVPGSSSADMDVPMMAPTILPVMSESQCIQTLRDYAARPDPERQNIVDSMICHLLQDEAFAKLCRDVENAWRRIGLEVPR